MDGANAGNFDARLIALENDRHDIKFALERIEGTLRGVEASVRVVETSVRVVEASLRGVELSVAELKGRVSQLPTTIQMTMFVLGVLVIAGVGQFLSFRFPKP